MKKRALSRSAAARSGERLGSLFVVALVIFRVYTRLDRNQQDAANLAPPPQQAPPQVGFQDDVDEPQPAVANPEPNLNPGIAIQQFPEPSAPREIEPGVTFQELVLGTPGQVAAAGWTGKIWIYLPVGEHDARSLPCVLIAPAGSNLLMGNDLGNASDSEAVLHPERIPYVKAGFAVIAYEIDGTVPDLDKASEQETMTAIRQFLRARAGLVNAQIAFEYARTKVPSVDPTRISAVGHSSAGTLAVLLAENEPRLKACAVFAPALDLAKRFGPQAVAQFHGMGIGDVSGRYSPKNGENDLKCPMFLFHAEDDSNVPVADSQDFARRAQANGKSVTLDIVPSGNHYLAMIDPGISHAIAWLKQQGAGPNR